MDGDPGQAEICFLFSRRSAEHLQKTAPPSYFSCTCRTQKETRISFFIFFSPSPFAELSALCTWCIKFPQAITADAFLHKRHWCGVRRGPLTKRWFFAFRGTHTHSAWVPKEKRPKHVLHINRSYIHGQSRAYEWNPFMCLWLISQS